MELYTFGFNGCSQLQFPGSAANIPTPTCVLRAKSIKVLWASWCDAVIAHKDSSDRWSMRYTGQGLTDAQRKHVAQSEEIVEALNRTRGAVTFFGTAMHEGLRGYVLCINTGSEYSVVIFATDLEIEKGVPEIQTYVLQGSSKALTVSMGSNGDVFVNTTLSSDGQGVVLRFQDLAELQENLVYSFFDAVVPSRPRCASFEVVQLCSNSTTVTALSSEAIYTSTRDPRYPRCLARSYEGTEMFTPIPYLSETNIKAIASGGYMTAAMSAEGELFLWGQTCPGSTEELAVLRDDVVLNHRQSHSIKTGISVEDEQDELVKCLMVRVDGEEARVYKVAVGHGHVLVAAEVQIAGLPVKRAVLVAGDGSRGQLGNSDVRDFVRQFEEISALRGKKVEQLAAAGWSSFVVTHEN
jgi:nitrite reductase/ring-hydroxylating ferredoxin subunit